MSLNDIIETAGERTYRIKRQQALTKAKAKVETMSRERRHFMFINPGTEKLNLLKYALKQNTPKPKWCSQGTFSEKFELKNGKLLFEGLKVIGDESKRKLVKEMYFDPTKASTIEPIYLALREEHANLTKKDVRKVLMSLETYQLNHRRRRPPKVLGKMNLTKPGIIATDMFFPSKSVWETSNICLTIMDCWSRFSRVYVLERKTKQLTLKAFEKFFREFMSLGHRPKVLLADKGSEFIGLNGSDLFNKWGLTVQHPPTGTPVHIVEALQAQYMRRAEIFRTATLTNRIGDLMHLISDQLNKQPRRKFGNKTPLQLLGLSKGERADANKFSNEHGVDHEVVGLKGLPTLLEGNKVRFLTWTRKQQVEGKVKGYSEKWSRSIHTIRKMIRVQKNRDVFKYYISDMPNYFWRHELLKITGKVDDVVPKLFEPKIESINESWKDKPKQKPKKPKKKPHKFATNVDSANIISRPRRKKKVNYAQFY